MMRRKHLSVPLVAAALVGCAGLEGDGVSGVSRTRDTFGEAVREARLRQTLDPDAARRAPVQSGLDASAAIAAWRRYQESFRSPPPAIEVLGIGTGAR